MENLQGIKNIQSDCFPKIHYKEHFFDGYHENGLITCNIILYKPSLSKLIKKCKNENASSQVKKGKRKKIYRGAFRTFLNIYRTSRNKLTDWQKAHIRCLTHIPSVKYLLRNLHFRCLTQISPIFEESFILDV